MFLSREINIKKLCKSHTKSYIYKILHKNRSFKQIILIKYATNLKTTISQRSLENLGLYQFLETGTQDITLIDLDQLLKCLGFSLYPLSFFLNSPFKDIFLAQTAKLYKL